MYKRPDVNLLTAYTKGLEGWADRVVPPAVARTVMWDLASLAEVLWLGLTRHKLQLMQKHKQQQNHKVYSHQHYINVGKQLVKCK